MLEKEFDRQKGTRLAGKVAIVTGAGTRGGVEGTGQATAIMFARQGAKVILADLDVSRAEATLEVIQEEGGEASIAQGDITNEDDCIALVEQCMEQYGNLDILMNNVGLGASGKVTEIDSDFWDLALDVNLKSMVLLSKHAIPKMADTGGGSIINIASIDGIRAGFSANIPYAAAKGGVVAITRAMAVHHGRQNIRVNCIAPGHIHASFVKNLPDRTRQLRRKAGPLGTEGTAWDIAWTSVFLGSEESRWISGVVIPVDGGLFAGTPLSVLDNILEED